MINLRSEGRQRSQDTTAAHSKQPGRLRLVLPLLLLLYFLYFSWRGLVAPFAIDTFANIDTYWKHDARWLAVSQFQLWSGHYRPMGGVFYLPLFHFFGLNPFPYHVVMMTIVSANVYLVYLPAIWVAMRWFRLWLRWFSATTSG